MGPIEVDQPNLKLEEVQEFDDNGQYHSLEVYHQDLHSSFDH
jgi:hypothetical protein